MAERQDRTGREMNSNQSFTLITTDIGSVRNNAPFYTKLVTITYHQTAETKDAVVHCRTQIHAANPSDNSEDFEDLRIQFYSHIKNNVMHSFQQYAQIR